MAAGTQADPPRGPRDPSAGATSASALSGASPFVGTPDAAVILAGFADGPAPDAARRLARQMADCARHGFCDVLILGGPSAADEARAAQTLLAAAGLARPTLRLVPAGAPTPREALRALAGHLPESVLVLDDGAVLDANLLDLMAAVAPGVSAVAAVLPQAVESGPRVFAGAALLAARLLAQDEGTGTLTDLLADLDAAGRLATRLWDAAARVPRDEIPPVRPMRPALFLDRDGTLNVDFGYVYQPEKLVLLPGAVEAVKLANDLGFYVFLVTNQSGVGRGYYAEEDVIACNGALQARLRAAGAHLDDLRYCLDHPEAPREDHRRPTGWRKPEPGMLIDLMAHWPVDAHMSLMIGDKDSDVEAGRRAGVASHLFTGGSLDAVLAPLLEARRPRESATGHAAALSRDHPLV